MEDDGRVVCCLRGKATQYGEDRKIVFLRQKLDDFLINDRVCAQPGGSVLLDRLRFLLALHVNRIHFNFS